MSDTVPAEIPQGDVGEALDRVKMDDLVVPGDTGLAAGYTMEEIEKARKLATEIIEGTKETGEAYYAMIEKAVAFNDAKEYKPLGFASFKHWYHDSGFSQSTIYMHMEVYRQMATREIPIKDYHHLDIGKIAFLAPLLTAGINEKQTRNCLKVLHDQEMADWRTWMQDALLNFKAGRELGDPTPLPSTEVKTGIPPGRYRIVPLEKENLNLADPRISGGLEKLKGVKMIIYLDAERDAYFAEVIVRTS